MTMIKRTILTFLKNFWQFSVGFGFWFLVLTGAGANWTGCLEVNQGKENMSHSADAAAGVEKLPPLDATIPARVETFTFGLG